MNHYFSSLFSLGFLSLVFHSLLRVIKRFPLVVLSLVVINLIMLVEIHSKDLLSDVQIGKILLAVIGAVFWFTSMTLLSESRMWTRSRYLLMVLPVYILYSWYISLQYPWSLSSWSLIIAAGLAITFSAWLFRRSDNASVWFFNYQLMSALFFALLSGLILSGGFSLIFVSTDFLFDIKMDGKIYADTWLIGMALFAPIYFLSNIPEQFDYPDSECQFPSGVNFILSYVLVPLSLVYMFILYAYMIKIVIQWQLPQGQLGTMISAFGVIGIFTHLAIYPIQQKGYALLGWFYRYFYIVMLVPLGLLMLAIGERISQYGITQQRYIVAAIAIWFATLIIGYFVKRQQFRLQQVTISLAVIIVFSSFGPWGIQQLPVNDQFARLEAKLIQEKLLIKGQLKVSQQPDFSARKSIISMLTYLLENKSAGKLRPWFEDKQAFDEILKCELKYKCYRSDAKKLVALMNLDYINAWQAKDDGQQIEITRQELNVTTNTKPIFSVEGYDYFIPLNRLSYYKNHSIILQNNFTKEPSEFTLKLDEQGVLNLTTTGGDTLSFNLTDVVAQFDGDKLSNVEVIEEDKLILNQQNQTMTGKLYIDYLKLQDNKVKQVSARLLLKLKD